MHFLKEKCLKEIFQRDAIRHVLSPVIIFIGAWALGHKSITQIMGFTSLQILQNLRISNFQILAVLSIWGLMRCQLSIVLF
jgi:hypothetical protein